MQNTTILANKQSLQGRCSRSVQGKSVRTGSACQEALPKEATITDVRRPSSADWDRWTPNIRAWSNWTGSVTLDSDCPIGRESCVIKLGIGWDDCPYFMGVRDFESTKACCGYLLNKDEADA